MKRNRETTFTTAIHKSKNMKKGTVKWYNEVKGYGFIASETGDEIFVHRTGLHNSYSGLQPDQEVIFDTKEGEKGLFAVDVKTAV